MVENNKIKVEKIINGYKLSKEEVIEKLQSDIKSGLSNEECKKRQIQFGKNKISPGKKKSLVVKFFLEFHQPLIYILLVAGAVTLFLQEWVEAGVIFGVTLINATIGFIQEHKAQNAIAALAKSVTTDSTVIRSGNKLQMSAENLVPGDLVLLTSGDKVPADLRLLEARELQANEAFLTGESMPVEKTTETINEQREIADRSNIAYAGSLITQGRGMGIIIAISNETETGRISKLMEESEIIKTPFMLKIEAFSLMLLYVILSLAFFTFLITIFIGLGWVEGFKAAVALAVSAIPEGLPAIVTVTLAMGVSRMARRNAIIRKLSAVETLGSTTVICSDKTGTLTKNQMTVQKIYAGMQSFTITGIGYSSEGQILFENKKIDNNAIPEALLECLQAGLLCNESHIQTKEGSEIVVGDPTEGALIVSAGKGDLYQKALENEYPRLDSIAFESKYQYMSTIHRTKSSNKIIYVKGSIESVLDRCEKMVNSAGEAVLLEKEEILENVKTMAGKGLRVLAFAKKEVDVNHKTLSRNDIKSELVFIGLQAMIDPPRPEAIEAVKACKVAGIKVKMITGDHSITAKEIARQIDILEDKDDSVFTGTELGKMTDEQLQKASQKSTVFSRVPPEIKLRLVKAFQSNNEVVAMTGDGVNDAPALKQADIGVSMGVTGTEVAKEASDMVLTDDNFASIEAAVEEGRTVYLNLLKVIAFILPVNGGEMLTIMVGILFLEALPILPVQILWINMLSSVALSIPLAFEPKPDGIMKNPPRSPNEPLLSKNLIVRIIIISIFNLIASFGIFKYIMTTTNNLVLARTMAVHTLVAAECFYLLSISSLVPSLLNFIKNRGKILYVALIGISSTVLLQFSLSQIQFMNDLFSTTPISINQALMCVGAGLIVVFPALLITRWAPLR